MALVGDDCFFFLNSGCVRGSQCTFRHQPSARITPIVCPQWQLKSCFKPNCVLRHNDDRVPCYYEANLGACLKPHCQYLHIPKSNQSVLPTSASVNSIPVPPIQTVITQPRPAVNVPLPNNMQHMVRPITAPVCLGQVPNMKLTPIFMGSRPQLQMVPANRPQLQMVPAIKDVSSLDKPEQVMAGPQVMSVPPPRNVSILGVPPAGTVFPKNEHFSEQVRLFKEMLAAKTGGGSTDQRKYKDNERHTPDDEKNGAIFKIKERQRNKKDRKEKEGYKPHKSKKESKEVWSKADEEILYGDYKNVPLDRKPKRKKHKQQKADSDTEVKVKSYEEILREKALRKLFSKRKEKFNEDFEELVSDKTNHRKIKNYNSDGDVAEHFDTSSPKEERRETSPPKEERRVFDTPLPKEERRVFDTSTPKEERRVLDAPMPKEERRVFDTPPPKEERRVFDTPQPKEEKRVKSSSPEEEIPIKRSSKNEVSVILITSKVEEEKPKNKLTDKLYEPISDNEEAIEKALNSSKDEFSKSESPTPEKNKRTKESKRPEIIRKEESDQTDSEPDSYPDSQSSYQSSDDLDYNDDYEEMKNEKITAEKPSVLVIPDETTSIDFSVDYDDDLAMEINQNEQNENVSSKTKKISSVINIINKNPQNGDPPGKKKYRNKSPEKDVTDYKTSSRYYGKSDIKSNNDRDRGKSPDSKPTDRDRRRKLPKAVSNDKPSKSVEIKNKLIKLVNADESDDACGRATPIVTKKNTETDASMKPNVLKVKTFEEIMAEKHRRSNSNHAFHAIADNRSSSVISVSDGLCVPKTLKEKSTQAKLEILNVDRNGNSSTLSPVEAKPVKQLKSVLTNPKAIMDDDKHMKRKSLQLYKPPQPSNKNGHEISTEVKTVVDTGPRKIIRKHLQEQLKQQKEWNMIRKASLSTGLIDQATAGDTLETTKVNITNDKDAIKVLSFEEIIREKRLRQMRERELAKVMEKENTETKEDPGSPSATVRRKPVIRRQIPPSTSFINTGSNCVSNALSDANTTVLVNSNPCHRPLTAITEFRKPVSAITDFRKPVSAITEFRKHVSAITEFKDVSAITEFKQPVGAITEFNHPVCAITEFKQPVGAITEFKQPVSAITEFKQLVSAITEFKQPVSAITEFKQPVNTITEFKQSVAMETNVAKVSPLKVVPQNISKPDISNETSAAAPQTEVLENKDFYSRLRNCSSRRKSVTTPTRSLRSVTSLPLSLQKDGKVSPTLPKVRRRSVTSHAEASVSPTLRVATLKITPFTFNSAVQPNTTSHQTKTDVHSRKDIQEALDEEKRKKEQDLLSDDEFEKEINELCSADDDDEEFDDINEDDLMMELEQMIDG